MKIGDLVTWKVKEHREWSEIPLGIVIYTWKERDCEWCKVTFTTGYRAGSTFDIREEQIRSVKHE
jgi:hypothetical protein|tara:strand:- start:3123 stop:3317 length:195 start_codon:yes stop_codon:yes gene_type:complete